MDSSKQYLHELSLTVNLNGNINDGINLNLKAPFSLILPKSKPYK